MSITGVVTYQTADPRDGRVHVCVACERRLRAAGAWPRGRVSGQEMCSVYMGQHRGVCDVADCPTHTTTPA